MRHIQELPSRRDSVKGGWLLLGATLLLGAAGCDSDPTVIPAPRFAQIGSIQIEVASSLHGGLGRLDEAFLWSSEGGWVLIERISYRGVAGPGIVRQSRLNPGELAPQYAILIRELNETPGLRLPNSVPTSPVPTCAEGRSRLTLTLRDTPSGEQLRWVRCVEGTFFTMTPGSAGPDPQASRVVTAAQITRSFTIGDGERSSFVGTVPFLTIASGSDSPARPLQPRAFVSQTGAPPPDFLAFWAEHAGNVALPPVNWITDMVVLAAVGRRGEAGGSVEVRRILPIGVSTRVEIVERVPGDFCSPGAVGEYPFHLVIAPKVTLPVGFADVRVDRIPCGI